METQKKKQKRRRAIAKDYYKSPLGNAAIGKKYGISYSLVQKVALEFEPEVFNEPEEDWCVVKVERKDVERVRGLLTKWGIKNEIPEKFELTEYYESNINPK